MRNLAGNPDCDRYIRDELTRCGIDIVEAQIDHPEVKSGLRGILRAGGSEFRFTRNWYYWSVRGPVPLKVARKLYETVEGRQYIRVAGHCGCPPPDEWATHYTADRKKLVKPFTETEIRFLDETHPNWRNEYEFSDDPFSESNASFVELYHIDSEFGLSLFVQTIKQSMKRDQLLGEARAALAAGGEGGGEPEHSPTCSSHLLDGECDCELSEQEGGTDGKA